MIKYYKPRISRIWFLIENANAVSTTMVGENNIPERSHNLNSLRGALTRDKCSRSTIFVLRIRIESIISYIDDLYDGGVASVDSREVSPGLAVAEAERSSCELSEHSSVHFRVVFSKFRIQLGLDEISRFRILNLSFSFLLCGFIFVEHFLLIIFRSRMQHEYSLVLPLARGFNLLFS